MVLWDGCLQPSGADLPPQGGNNCAHCCVLQPAGRPVPLQASPSLISMPVLGSRAGRKRRSPTPITSAPMYWQVSPLSRCCVAYKCQSPPVPHSWQDVHRHVSVCRLPLFLRQVITRHPYAACKRACLGIALLSPRQHFLKPSRGNTLLQMPGASHCAPVPLRQALTWLQPLLFQHLFGLPSGNSCRMRWRFSSNFANSLLLCCS